MTQFSFGKIEETTDKKIVQVVTGSSTTSTSVSTTTYADLGLSAEITPASTDNTIFVMLYTPVKVDIGGTLVDDNGRTAYGQVQLLRDSTPITETTIREVAFEDLTTASLGLGFPMSIIFYDGGISTTSATTYKIQGKMTGLGGGSLTTREITAQYNNEQGQIILIELE